MNKTFNLFIALIGCIIALPICYGASDAGEFSSPVSARKRSLSPLFDIETFKDSQPRQRERLRDRTPSRTDFRTKFIFDAEQQKRMLAAGLSPSLIEKMAFLSTAMLRSPDGSPGELTSYFTKDEIATIGEKLSSLDEFSIILSALKRQYPKKISPRVLKDRTNILSPIVRMAITPKERKRTYFASVTKALENEGVPIRSVAKAISFAAEEEEPESEEAKADRRRLEARLFEEGEALRGIPTSTRDSALTREEAHWESFIFYIENRTKGIEDGITPHKIKRAEVEDVFLRFVSHKYQRFNIDGCTLFVNLKDIDADRTTITGETNLSLLSRGVAPIGPDGKPMNLHHLTRTQPGILILISESFHQKHTHSLHLRSEKHMRQPKPLDRRDFNAWKIKAFEIIHTHITAKSTG
jgi:hypothetical protein